MDRKTYNESVAGLHSNINRTVGDGGNSIKNGIISRQSTLPFVSHKSKRNANGVNTRNNNFKSKSNITSNNNNNFTTSATKTMHTTNAIMASEAAAVSMIPQQKQQQQPTSPVNTKTPAMATVRMKNEEAVNDLRQRIPEIEKIFDVHTRIGNGTFSTVLLGTLKKERHLPEEKRRKYAIKHHIPTSHPERIMRELQCMVNIGGIDNVVGINCCMRCNESVAFIMPYMQHDRFHDFFNKMDLAEVQFYMKNLLQALRRVHRFNVIHRDVKPSNFLYNRSKRQFLLVDFGLAQQAPMSQMQVEAIAAATQKSSGSLSLRIAGGGCGEGNKRAREQDNDDDDEAALKSCLGTTGSDTAASITKNNDGAAAICGVSKRLRCTGPYGDQQVAAGVTTGKIASGGNAAQPRNDSTLMFKMPLKQLNEITMPGNGKTLTVTTISGNNNNNSNANVVATQSVTAAVTAAATAAGTDPAKYNTNRNLSAINAAKCFCYGNAQVCNICLIKKEIHASRAGTPGYRPPEVLLKYADQTTAVDIWAAGVIFLSILSSVYPFFKAPNDFVALAEMVTIFGDKSIRNTACVLERLITLSQHSKPLDLRKLCVRFRNRVKFSSPDLLKRHQKSDGSCEVCKNCDQYYYNCLCAESNYKTEPLDCDDTFPKSAYDLLYQLLEVNPHRRITAEQALHHPFFSEVSKKSHNSFGDQTTGPIKNTSTNLSLPQTATNKSAAVITRK